MTRPAARVRTVGVMPSNVDQSAIRRGRAWLKVGVSNSVLISCLLRFTHIGGRDRALALAGQAFTTLVPLFIVLGALGAEHGTADVLVDRFDLTGSSAQAVRSLFAHPPGAAGGVTVVGGMVLLFSLLSFSRSLQRTYELAWGLPALGLTGTLSGLTGVGMLITGIVVLAMLGTAVHGFFAASVLSFVLRAVLACGLWLVLQYFLLSRRVCCRRLVPGAVTAGVGHVLLSVYSARWMPHVMNVNADRYGVIGVTFAMLTWLIVVCGGVVAVAVVSAEFGPRESQGQQGNSSESGDADGAAPDER